MVAPRAPAASRKDSRSQAILKFHHPSSLDYRVRHELPVWMILSNSCMMLVMEIFLKKLAHSGYLYQLDIVKNIAYGQRNPAYVYTFSVGYSSLFYNKK